MIALSVGLKLIQEAKAEQRGREAQGDDLGQRDRAPRRRGRRRSPVSHLVPGDVVELAAGDMIPGDVRIVQAKDLFVIQGSLTGESFPVEKFEVEKHEATTSSPHRADEHRLPRHQRRERLRRPPSSSRRARRRTSAAWPSRISEHARSRPRSTAASRASRWLMLRFMAVMVPLVFVINGLTKGSWSAGVLLRPGGGRRPHARDAADDRDGVPVEGRGRDGQEEGHRQAAQRDPEPRRDGRALHRQDRHAHAGRGHPRAPLRRRAARGRRRARARVHQQPLPDRPQERPRPRRPRARGDATRTRAFPSSRRSTRSPSTSSGASCRSSSARRRARTASSPRALPRRSSRGARSFMLDGELLPMDHQHIEELKKEYERLSADGFRVLAIATQGRRATRDRRGRRHPVRQGRRVRPDPRGLRRVPRPAEGDAPPRPSRRSRRTASRSRSSPATTTSSRARSARRSGCSTDARPPRRRRSRS